MSVNKDHALRLREMIAAMSTGASPSSFGPAYIEALTAGAAALDPRNQISTNAPLDDDTEDDTEDESEPPTTSAR